MPGPLTALTFPTPADLLAAGWSTWWRDHKLPPSPVQILESARAAFWIWRDDLMQEHSNYLAVRLGDRLLPLFDLVADLVAERVDCRGWEFPDPDEEEEDVVTTWIAWGLTCLRWTLLYDERDQPEVTYAEASTFMLYPAAAAGHHAARAASCSTATRSADPILTSRAIVRPRTAVRPPGGGYRGPNSDDRQTHARHRAAPTG